MTAYPKTKQIKLTGKARQNLKLEVWERDSIDGYPVCQHCHGENESPIDKWPHHIIYKSALGDDSLENLVTLCMFCHSLIHKGKLFVNLDMEFSFENPKYSSGGITENEDSGQHHQN